MANSIYIIGGLQGDPSREDLLARLVELDRSIQWDWIRVTGADHYRLSESETNKYLGRLRTKMQESCSSGGTVRVVKLYLLHGRLANRLYAVCRDPVHAPRDLGGVRELLDWLSSREAGLLPPREWFANTSEAALVAVLCKLLRNKSWNKDMHGHTWTKEHDLLNQSPVRRPKHDLIYKEARGLLRRMKGGLLLRKGGSQTPIEWCINVPFLPLVKKAIIACSLEVFLEDETLGTMILDLMVDENRTHQLLGEIVDERVRSICTELRNG